MFIECDDETKIKMVEGDFGIVLPIEIEGIEIAPEDIFSIKIFKDINEELIIEKTYDNVTNNTINFELTKENSEKLKVGRYYYDLDWYQGEKFLGNLVAKSTYTVIEKAGE